MKNDTERVLREKLAVRKLTKYYFKKMLNVKNQGEATVTYMDMKEGDGTFRIV